LERARIYKGVAKYTSNFNPPSSTQNPTLAAGNDSLVDVPTNGAQTDTGVGGEVRGNYATWNPLITSTNLTNGNLSVVQPSTTAASRYATIGMSSGKWYWEINVVKYSNTVFGIRTPGGGTLETPYDASGYGMGWRSSGGFFIGASNTGTGSMSLAAGDVLGLAFDAGAGTLAFYKNGTLNNTLTASSTYIGQTWFAGSQDSGGGNSDHDVNFGQRPFTYTAPSGFKALCTANLPAPLVTKPSTVFNTYLWSGNGGTQTISTSFSPDFVWVKQRDNTNVASHVLVDIVRGNNNVLRTNGTDAENAAAIDPALYDGVTNLSTASFDVVKGSSGTYNGTNGSGKSYVGWCWDAGNTTVTNTQGSISSQVRANASAGFSIVTYTGNSTVGATVGHGLGVAPQLIIIKARNNVSGGFWQVYHQAIGNTKYLELNSTSAAGTSSNRWNNTTPSSTVFTLGSDSDLNGSLNYVAYCFAPVAGYSSFGSYTGNGSADGPFVYTGFRPRFILVKRTDGVIQWTILDTARSPSNVADQRLFPNLSQAETVNGDGNTDLLSNGFKPRNVDSAFNANGGTYIYMALAESPFQYARAR